jgi:Leucine-rich repeat (LRR) protein
VLHIGHTDGVGTPLDLSPATTLKKLTTLEVMAANALSLSPLKQMSGLSELTIIGTGVSFRDLGYSIHLADAGAIGDLRGLRKLGLAWVDVRDTSFLEGLDQLREIYINQTRSLSDVRTMGALLSLQSVQLVATSVVDISPLLNLPNLKRLTLQVTPARMDVVTELKRRGVSIREH